MKIMNDFSDTLWKKGWNLLRRHSKVSKSPSKDPPEVGKQAYNPTKAMKKILDIVFVVGPRIGYTIINITCGTYLYIICV